MNKLRLIRIYELKGKAHPMEAFMIEILDGIEEVPHQDYIEYRTEDFEEKRHKNGIYTYDRYTQYSKGGKLYFYHYLNTNNFYLPYGLYEEYEAKFGCSYEETREILKYILEKHLKIEINNVK